MLEFEKSILELDARIAELKNMTGDGKMSFTDEISRLQIKSDRLLRQAYAKLTPAQKVLVSRHPERPHFVDYVRGMIEDFTPLAGDRNFGEDAALIGGVGRFRGQSVVVMGQEKGSDTTSRIKHNFGMARPEGYRKAQRLMAMATQFSLPVITLVDTAGAYPGVGAEERGQAEAIAKSIEVCLRNGTPIISTIIGEGGSGGAIAIATGDRVYMLEHSIYSVISPEGCASILWRSATHAQDAAVALKVTAQDLYELKLIDAIIPEPTGAAHRDKPEAIRRVADQVEKGLRELSHLGPDALKAQRAKKYLAMGRQAA